MSEKRVEFIELVFPMMATFGMDEREGIAEALHSRLVAEGMGEITGAGAGLGVMNLDVDIEEVWQHRVEEIHQFMLGVLSEFRLPPGSTMRLWPFSEARVVIGNPHG